VLENFSLMVAEVSRFEEIKAAQNVTVFVALLKLNCKDVSAANEIQSLLSFENFQSRTKIKIF
jgi:hypothetical protein